MSPQSRHAPTLEILARTLTAYGRLGTSLAQILSTNDHRRVVSTVINPNGYSHWRHFFADYSAVNLVKKYPFLSLPGVNPKEVAIAKFRESETRCRMTNFKFYHPQLLPHSSRVLLARAKREVKRILGKFSLDDILPFLSHGPGATFGTRKDRGHPWFKFGDLTPTVTGECLALHRQFLNYCELWDNIHRITDIDPKVVVGSKVTTVPKDARADRVIAIEPLLNMFYQKGIGGLMRSRLKRSGCDLNDQTINQAFAYEGSKTNLIATIDLSSASDSVSRALVEYLLPEDWLQFLNATRSNYSCLDGEILFLQKYSSMGNGYTFELESLIFLALGRAVAFGSTESIVSVYGDDIAISSNIASELIDLLNVCGFSTNREKSFLSGPFRESCGKHYFLGYDVSPLYVKADIQSQDRYLWYLNSVKRFAYRFAGMGYGCSDQFKDLYGFLYQFLNPKYRSLSIPEGYGDGGVVRDFDECVPRPSAVKHWVEGYTTRQVVRVYKSFKPHGYAQLLVSLFRLGFPSLRNPYRSLRTMETIPIDIPYVRKYRWVVSRLSVSRWQSLGPWVSLP